MAQKTVAPRALESDLLVKAAARLQAIRDDWANRAGEVDDAVSYNRRLWATLVASVMGEDNPLPIAIKQNIVNLGIFVFSQSYEIGLEPKPEKLAALVTINRELAAGLRAQADAAEQPAPPAGPISA